jgi:cell pole-organizing protein PopZ
MEEILSSIRRIIADEDTDDNGPGDDELGAAEARSEALDDDAEARARAAEEEDDSDEDVLELTKMVRESGEVIDLQGERSSADDAMYDDEARHDDGARDDDDQRMELAPADHAPEEEPAGAGREHIQRKDQVVHSDHARAAELMSATTASVAGGAFAKLSQALQRTPEEESVAETSGRTVEQFIEDIARPMLKEWLDENLPPIVERLVQKEIQKISRRAELI